MNKSSCTCNPPMGLMPSFAIYICAAAFLYLETHWLIPWLCRRTGMESILFWFLVAGLGVFVPLILAALVILRREGYSLTLDTWRMRLRFRAMTRLDWIWTVAALIAIGALSAAIMQGLEWLVGRVDPSPPFMAFMPLAPGRYWLLAVWFPFWILNIMGEELLWRGVMLPRQEEAWGRYAWLIHAAGWGLFHFAFGWQLLVTLLPILLILPFIVQRRGNSWVGVIIHAGLNGPSFVAIALGWL